ncbi:hypothetical protein BXY53_0809 [Dichotomicrobium thermohalophilum]|uniref:Uncharacterized protein n=1 Tax=Dichotomicrobium thermohalophilum TaxID=933063 RepID=A0A397Q475_9HYPH|nr:hypothetical protein BXY53_0809 [Dichotomicrobium thermohalophilum]
MPVLDAGIHSGSLLACKLDCRIKSGNDEYRVDPV